MDRYAFLIISRSVLHRMRNVSDKSCTENQITHFMFNNFFPENRVVYEIMWKNIVQADMTQMTIWRMRFVCWIRKATKTHWEYLIFISFPLQQWLHYRASMLRYTYIACIVVFSLQFEHSDEQHAIFANELQSALRLTVGFSNVYCELWQICHSCVKKFIIPTLN